MHTAVTRASVAVIAALPACIVPYASPATNADAGYMIAAGGARPTLRAGTDVVGARRDADARWNLGVGYSGTTSTKMTASVQGIYAEAAYLARVGARERVSIGPGFVAGWRGNGEGFEPITYLRTGFELFGIATSDDVDLGAGTQTAVRGQAGVGAYCDVEHAWGDRATAIVVGLSVRLPAFAGVGVAVP